MASYPQGDNRPATEDETAGGSGLKSVIFKDVEADDANPDENYEAAVWAKVTLADLSTRKLGQKQEKAGGDHRAGAGRSEGGASARRKKKKKKRKKKVPNEVSEDKGGIRLHAECPNTCKCAYVQAMQVVVSIWEGKCIATRGGVPLYHRRSSFRWAGKGKV